MTLDDLKTQLLSVCPEVHHLAAPEGVDEYIVYHRYSEVPAIGDDAVCLSIPMVQLDIITQDPDAELADKAKELLVELGIVWFEAGYGYDDDWAAIRCVLQFALD